MFCSCGLELFQAHTNKAQAFSANLYRFRLHRYCSNSQQSTSPDGATGIDITSVKSVTKSVAELPYFIIFL